MQNYRLLTLVFLVTVVSGTVSAQITESVNSDQNVNSDQKVVDFSINGETHNITLNFIDGGANFRVDGAVTKYVRPLDINDHEFGLFHGDTFTVNGITVEVLSVKYSSDLSRGTMRFRAYPEEKVKRIVENQERQFHIDGHTNVLALKHSDGPEGSGAVFELNGETYREGSETIKEFENFSMEIRDSGYENNTAFMEYKIRQEDTEEDNLGRVTAQCEVGRATQGYELQYFIQVPDSSNYRDLNVKARIGAQGEEYTVMEKQERRLEAGETRGSGEITLPTPVAIQTGEKDVYLELLNAVGEGSMRVNCGKIDLGSNIKNVSIVVVEKSGTEYQFTTRAKAEEGLEEISWDLNGDNQYEREGRSVEKLFQSSGDKTVSLRVTDRYGNTEEDSKTIEVESSGVEEASISLGRKRIQNGQTQKIKIQVPEKEARSGYRTVVENPSGGSIWEQGGEDIRNSYSLDIDDDWGNGKYTVKVLPSGNIISSVFGMLTGEEALAQETFTVIGERWKSYCEQRGYDTDQVQSQVECIQTEIVPNYFQDTVGNSPEVAESLCSDLLDYSYSRQQRKCMNQ